MFGIWEIVLLLVLLIPLFTVLLDSPVGKALARRLEGDGASEPKGLLSDRLRYLEGELDRLGTRLERLEEESDFLHRLLVERTSPEQGGGNTLEAGESDD